MSYNNQKLMNHLGQQPNSPMDPNGHQYGNPPQTYSGILYNNTHFPSQTGQSQATGSIPNSQASYSNILQGLVNHPAQNIGVMQYGNQQNLPNDRLRYVQHQQVLQQQQRMIHAQQQMQQNLENISQMVFDLSNPDKREAALLELSKKRETVPDLAPILWHSFGTIACLLQEIVAIYPLLSPPKLKAPSSNRVCNALALLQCVASHSETRGLFLQAHIPLYLYPFLNTTSKNRPFEYLRLTSLGVIGALVKLDDSDVIGFLLSTEIIPLCLRIMETGSELSKTVATFIVQKILLDDMGLSYICATYERFYAVRSVLNTLVGMLTSMEQPQRLLKHIVRCYLRLSDHSRSREALKPYIPESFKNGTFDNLLRDDIHTKRWLERLLEIMAETNYPSNNPNPLLGQAHQNSVSPSMNGSPMKSSAPPSPMKKG